MELDPEFDKDFNVNSKLVNVRGIYKDVYGSSLEYSDYQLRPNTCVAMVVVISFRDILGS
jgi:glycogen debranching enzyme